MYAVGDETTQCLSLDIMLTIFALFCYAQYCWLPPPPIMLTLDCVMICTREARIRTCPFSG